jgi:hypothetical protein
VGATVSDVATSLSLIDQSAVALQSSIVDDVHVGNHFAELLKTLNARIRAVFKYLPGAGSNGISRAGSRSPVSAISNGQQRHGNHLTQAPTSNVNNANHPWSQYMNSSSYFSGSLTPGAMNGSLHTVGGAPGPQTPGSNNYNLPMNPLEGISTEAYIPGSSNVNIMPPPNFDISTHQGFDGADFNFSNNNEVPDWLAIPLDPLINTSGADVTQTMYGPDIGGYDMLDVLLSGGMDSSA